MFKLFHSNLSVDIPCPGHAPLITGELNTIDGVLGVEFSFPNDFAVTYDSLKTSESEILGLEVFRTYKATVTGEKISKSSNLVRGCGTCSGCSGACGGSCGG